jgi:hypothetical protein
MKNHEDYLRLQGEFIRERRDEFTAVKGEQTPLRKSEDNLKPQGDFTGRKKDDFPVVRGERSPIKKPKDSLKPEGEFERPHHAKYGPGEGANIVKHPDN